MHVVREPGDELSRFQKALRFCYDLGRHGYRQLLHDRASQMAGALAFRALFALLPVLVVGTVLVRAVGGFERFKDRIAEFFTRLGLDEYNVTLTAPVNGSAAEQQTFSSWLLELIDQVEAINLAAIGWVGLAVVVYAAIQLMVNIEKSFKAFSQVRNAVQNGTPVPFCLYKGAGTGHHVLAIACEPNSPILIRLYDPNYPNKLVVLRQVGDRFLLNHYPGHTMWEGIFFDSGYRKQPPKYITGI